MLVVIVHEYFLVRYRLQPPRRNRWTYAAFCSAFDILRGEVLVVLGANGAGKSTLLQTLAFLRVANVRESAV